MKRFMLDNDGSNIFHNLGDDVEREVADILRECPPNVTTYLLCSGAGSCNFPTRVNQIDLRAKGLVAAHARGLDPFGMLLRGLKAAGKETFITYRMNDVHNPTDADQWNVPRIRRENPDCIVGLAEVKAGKAEWMSYCLDYARPEVRRYVLDLIREQIQLYGDTIDGFQLDWMRFPRHLAGTPEEVWNQRACITDFLGEVRAILGAAGRRILLGVRVPSSPAGCRRLGFDLTEWARNGLMDLLVACPFLTTEWTIPVRSFRQWMGRARIPVMAGFDFGFGRQSHCPESLRGICTSLYDCGADGIYLFNFPCWCEYLAARPYHWLTGLESRKKAAIKPLLLAVDHARHRIAGVDQAGQLPARLPGGGTLPFTIHVPKAALPVWRAMILVHSHGDIQLSLNDQPARPQRFMQQAPGAYRSEIFLEFVDQYFDKESRPRPEDCRIFLPDPAGLRIGANRLTLLNAGNTDLEIDRINLALW